MTIKEIITEVKNSTDETKDNYMTDGECVDFMIHELEKLELTTEQIKTYLIDVIGYREYELNDMDKAELMELVEDMNECIKFNGDLN